MITGDYPDWSALKPSSQGKLSRSEALALPEGIVVLRRLSSAFFDPCLIVSELTLPKPHPYYRFPYMTDGHLRWSTSAPLWLQGVSPEIRLPKLPRMSFALTTEAIRNRRKDVTRRIELPKWWQAGRWFLGVDRVRQAGAQGLCVAQCVSARREMLHEITQEDVIREGFPNTTPEGFIAMFSEVAPESWTRNGAPWLWRLEFRYLEVPT